MRRFFAATETSSRGVDAERVHNVNDVEKVTVKTEPGSGNQFKEFLKTIISFTGDLPSLAGPAFFLNGLSLLEYGTYWGDHPSCYKAIAASNHPQERILSVTRWFISTLWGSYASRCTDGSSEKKPYNPILGEQFHCSLEDIKCVCEQVCHLPPISAFYLENEKAGVSLNGHCGQKSKFKGTAIKVEQVGRATLYLKQYDEQYMINFPDLLIRGVLSGSCYLELSEISTIASTNGSKAVIEFLPKPWFGGEHNHIRGSIMWNGWTWGDLRLLFDAEAEPMAQRVTLPHDDQQEIESHRLWGRVTRALKAKNYQAANAQKTRIEEWQRKLRQERAERNETWAPALFNFQPDQQAKDEYTRRNVLLLKSMEGKPLLDDGAWIFKHSLHKRTF